MLDHTSGLSGNLPVQTVNVAGIDVDRLTYKGMPVVTFAMVDRVHQRPDSTARQTFNRNRGRFVESEDYFVCDTYEAAQLLSRPAPNGATLLTQRGYLKLTKPMDDDRAWMVQGEMIDHYFATTTGALLPDFSNPAAAARAYADQYDRAQVAIRTKAEIGTRREATAMNTASQAVKRANALALALDRSKSYATVKRMSALYHGQPFNWRLLKQTSIEMRISSIDIFDANYGTVKAYHADVWREAYALEIPTGEGTA